MLVAVLALPPVPEPPNPLLVFLLPDEHPATTTAAHADTATNQSTHRPRAPFMSTSKAGKVHR
jgi:hypothetical protein